MFRKGINVFLLRFSSVLFSFTQLSLAAKLTDVSSFGQFLLFLSASVFLGLFLVFGLNQRCLKCIGEFIFLNEEQRAKDFAGLLIVITTLFSLLAVLVLIFLNFIFFEHLLINKYIFLLICVSAYFYALQLIVGEIFRSQSRYFEFIFYGGVFSVALFSFVASVLLFLNYRLTVTQLFFIYVLSLFFQCVFSYSAVRNSISYGNELNIQEALGELKLGFPIMLNSLFQFGIGPGVIAITGFVLTHEDVAIFGVAAKLSGLILFASTLVYSVFPNKIIELNIGRKYKRMELMVRCASFACAIGMLPLMLIFIMFGGYLLRMLYGEVLTAAYFPLIIMAFGNFFNVWTGMRGAILQLTGRNFQQLYITMIGGSLMIILVLIMGALWGGVGASFAFAIAVCCQCALEMFYVRKYLNIGTIGVYFSFKRFLLFKRILNVR